MYFFFKIVSAILAISRSMINDSTMTTKTAREAMTKVLSHAHYLPKKWIANAHLPGVQYEFQSLYQSKIVIVLNELLNVIFTPFILMFTLPECVEGIVTFIIKWSEVLCNTYAKNQLQRSRKLFFFQGGVKSFVLYPNSQAKNELEILTSSDEQLM